MGSAWGGFAGAEGLNRAGALILFGTGWNEFADSRIVCEALAACRFEGRRVGDENFGYLLKLETEERGAVIWLGAGSLA